MTKKYQKHRKGGSRKKRSMRGGDDGYGAGSQGMQTKPIEANDQQEAAANRQNEDNESLAAANNVQGTQNGGSSACAAAPPTQSAPPRSEASEPTHKSRR